MAPAAAPASILAARTSGAAAASKRPAASDVELLELDSSTLPPQGGDHDDAARSKGQQQPRQPPLECPRCRSTNTKFCYYNNYSTAQPRHFCRACRRYWTHGGTLRDVPVGGATRRGKRRRVSAEPPPSPQTPKAPRAEDACPDLVSAATAFPFLSDGSLFLPQFDLGAAPAVLPWPSAAAAAIPDFYDGLPPWDDGTVGASAGLTGAWGDIAGLELSWTPPGY